VDSLSREPFDVVSHSGTVSHHHLMRQAKSDEKARSPLLGIWIELKKMLMIQRQ
jgi:hypothetical protein